ncbi:MAG: putative lipid II flippase FtsW [Rickettsiales bacterium]
MRNRTDTGLLARWWWTVDRVNLFAILLLAAIGMVMVVAGSPPVAKRLGYDSFHFVNKHYMFLGFGLVVMIITSMLPTVAIRRLAVIGLAGSVILMMAVPIIGVENKGAHRWINLFGVSVQPSEFMKPFFAVVMGWICAENQRLVNFPGYKAAIGLYGLVALLLLIQPDLGMTITVSAMWAVQLFLAGLPMFWVILLVMFAAGGGIGAYYFFPHVAKRIDLFLDPDSGDNYQIKKSLEAFRSGGVFGKGPGEGEVKMSLPDSHTDFIFSVAGEEFGIVICLLILCLFAFIVLRSFSRAWKENDLFVILTVAGIATQFGFQAVINMGVAVRLFPAKGMTLPFISYGGSSLVAISLGMGIMLAFTRKNYGKKKR